MAVATDAARVRSGNSHGVASVDWRRLGSRVVVGSLLAIAGVVVCLFVASRGGQWGIDFRGGIWLAGRAVLAKRTPFPAPDAARLLHQGNAFVTPPLLAASRSCQAWCWASRMGCSRWLPRSPGDGAIRRGGPRRRGADRSQAAGVAPAAVAAAHAPGPGARGCGASFRERSGAAVQTACGSSTSACGYRRSRSRRTCRRLGWYWAPSWRWRCRLPPAELGLPQGTWTFV
jgi:hypothetical protein